jgi:cytochrome c oxidase subunit 1/cytochrome c oxidase subunit I+III
MNMVSTVGAFVIGAGFLVSLINYFYSRRRGLIAGKNPWQADSLEWSIDSPPAPYGSVHVPTVVSRHPLWDEHEEEEDPDGARILDQGRLTLATSSLDAEPVALSKMPEDTITPLLMALAMTLFFTALLLRWIWVAGLAVALIAAVNAVWLWPEEGKTPA